jgi:hypothetical protein
VRPIDKEAQASRQTARLRQLRRGSFLVFLQRRKNHRTFVLHQVDVDERPDLAEHFRIEKVPTLLAVADRRGPSPPPTPLRLPRNRDDANPLASLAGHGLRSSAIRRDPLGGQHRCAFSIDPETLSAVGCGRASLALRAARVVPICVALRNLAVALPSSFSPATTSVSFPQTEDPTGR